ncbi:MAG: ATP-dependent Clp protease adaptor ClpS [Phycisphaeraceae bacterium]|nr:MAG: ATP-dependent Clp protease adaptor ClpS [Phycisphaeraceae bacterium]
MAEQDASSTPEPSVAPSAAVKDRPSPPRMDQLPPFRVLLHNDDVNTLEWVVESIVELTPHTKERATVMALEAHVAGLTLIMTTHKERAELVQEQFTSKSLTVTIEPAE